MVSVHGRKDFVKAWVKVMELDRFVPLDSGMKK
jgi:catalase (peroxidase I)